MKGLVSHLGELGFSLEGSGGFLTRSGMICFALTQRYNPYMAEIEYVFSAY